MPAIFESVGEMMTSAVSLESTRACMTFDVVIVGAGPAGLATAIRLKQQAAQAGTEVSVVVLEKGAEVGAHIVSGAVIDPSSLDKLLPGWRTDAKRPLATPVSSERFYVLGPAGALRVPVALMPKTMRNHGCFIGSLGDLTQLLAAQAEALGVEIYPGFAGSELLIENDRVVGIATGDMGVSRTGKPKPSFEQGMELRGRFVILAEGAHGSLSKQAIARFALRKEGDPPKYGLGLKEVWRVPKEAHRPGLVQHTLGWPLDNRTGGGSFLYHYGDCLVSVGLVVHLDYANPTFSPFDAFQQLKTHPLIREVLEGGECLSFGARAITEGGWQSVPRLNFPGGALVGCAAGFVNVPRIKGVHNAIASGMLCADHLLTALQVGDKGGEITGYEDAWRSSSIGRDLYPVRNVKPLWSRFGTRAGVLLGAMDLWAHTAFGRSVFGTLRHGKPDFETLKPLDQVRPCHYPKPDGVLTFDRASSASLAGVFHEEDQPVHLRLADPTISVTQTLPVYGEPAQLYCPAGVYEIVYADEATRTNPRFVINAGNCVHCKTCDIKDPAQNITWVPPEGGNGPNYSGM